ncbi:hypothetical protein KCU62_g5334, partial [Aureobasidium sp. EXF-3399]
MRFYIFNAIDHFFTYGHSQLKTRHPVRSAIHKQLNGRLVLRWVTTWESLLLYVLQFVLIRAALFWHALAEDIHIQEKGHKDSIRIGRIFFR